MATTALPKTLVQAIRYFADPDVANDFVANLRWPTGPVCPQCESDRYSYLSTRRVWKCKDCKKQYSVKVGTIFEDSPIPLDMWLASIWLIANSKNGISSYELHRAIGITQKSAWFVLHRIRLAMQTGSFDKFDGEIEVDETFVGGKAWNMHKHVRARKITGRGRGTGNQTPVAGRLQRAAHGRPSQVRATVVTDTTKRTLGGLIRAQVATGSTIYSDAYMGYRGLTGEYKHESIDHATSYVLGRIHTNSIENFWALLKRGIHGTYVQVSVKHLFRYVDERVFTFNERDLTDFGRFTLVLDRVSGRRLMYKHLIA